MRYRHKASPKITKLNFCNTPVISEISPRCASELPKEVPRKVTVILRRRTRCCRTAVAFYGEMYDELVYSWRSVLTIFLVLLRGSGLYSSGTRGHTTTPRAHDKAASRVFPPDAIT